MAGSQDLADARQLHQQGVAQNLAGHPTRAIRTLRRALLLVQDRHDPEGDAESGALAARIWISLATSESELNGLPKGLTTLAQAEPIVARLGDPRLEVVLENQMGYMKVRGGQVAQGLDHLDRAVELILHADADTSYAILANRGTTHLFRGDLARARADLANAAALARAEGLVVDEIKARHNLGYLEFLAGNLALALRTMNDVLAAEVEFSRAVVLLDRSRVLFEAGLHREADESLIEAERLFRADRLWKDVAEVELARAECALIDGQISAARRHAGSARDRFRRRANDRWRRDAELVLLQADVAAGRPGNLLGNIALRLAAEFRDEGLATRARTAQLVAAEAFLRAGRQQQAREIATMAGPVRPNDPISARLQTRLVRAKLAVAAGTGTEARREIRTGLSELARHQAQFGSLDLQTASAIHGRQLAGLDLELALRTGSQSGLLATIERGRAISSRLPSVVAATDPAVADLLAELRRLSEELRTIESDIASARQVATKRRQVADLQRQLRSHAWQAEGIGQARQPATLPVMMAALQPASEIFLSLIESGGQLFGQLIEPGRSRTVRLCPANLVTELGLRVRADLDVLAIGRLPEPLAAAVRASLRRSLDKLDELLIAPLAVADLSLVIAPTGMLSMLPWNLLPSLVSRSVVVVPSATAWLTAGSPRSASAPTTVAAIAGPELARAAEEARQVSEIWGAKPASVRPQQRDLVSALGQATIVHVAAHGQHQPENPLFSSIRLADGPVFAYELDQHPRAAEHVVLSACELGQATIRPGDEALGLTSVLLHLGSRSVISGVARVHDDVAAEVMIRYHRALAGGAHSAQALADACAESGPMPAPFVCFGSSWRAG